MSAILNAYQEEMYKNMCISVFKGTYVFEKDIYEKVERFNFKTFWDICNSEYKSKVIARYKTLLYGDPQGYIDWYKYLTEDNYLPKKLDGGESLIEMTRKFIEQYYELADKLLHLPWN